MEAWMLLREEGQQQGNAGTPLQKESHQQGIVGGEGFHLLSHKNVVLHSVATALASRVFPVPLGPYSSTPFQGASRPEKSSGYLMGCTPASLSRRLAWGRGGGGGRGT